MGRRKNRKKHNQNTSIKKYETKAKADTCDEKHGAFGFASGTGRHDDDCSSDYRSYSAENYSSSYKKQIAQYPENVISTSEGFMEVVHSEAWGTVLIPVEDPKALTLTFQELNSIKLIDDFPKIPTRLWSRWVKLCLHQCYQQDSERKLEAIRQWNSVRDEFEYFHYVDGKKVMIDDPSEVLRADSKYRIISEYSSIYAGSGGYNYTSGYKNYQKQLEVEALLCRKMDNLSEWKIVIPKQQVTHASVHAETAQSVDIETGEIYKVFPPTGWLHAGSTHSHNTMAAFYSKTDDDSELTVPGLHIVIGSINREKETYDAVASIVLRQIRKKVSIKDVVEDEDLEDVDFHPNVLECISNSSSTSETSKTSSPAKTSSDDDVSSIKGRYHSGRYFDFDDHDYYDNSDDDTKNEEIRDDEETRDNEETRSDEDRSDKENNEEISPKENEESWWASWKKKLLGSYKPYKSRTSLDSKHKPCDSCDISGDPTGLIYGD